MSQTPFIRNNVKNHIDDTTDIDHMFIVKPAARQVVVVALKVALVVSLFASMFLFGAMYGAHKAANDPEFVKEYLELKASGYEKGR